MARGTGLKRMSRKVKKNNRRNVVVVGNAAAAAVTRAGWGKRFSYKHWTAKSIYPFPVRQMVRLRYCDIFQFTTNASYSNYMSQHLFKLGSLYDPDNSGVGHEPYPVDVVKLIYKRYQVMDVKVKLEWFDPSTDGLVVGYNLMYQGDCTGMGIGEVSEKPFSKLTSLNNTGSQVATQTFTVGLHELLGLRRSQYRSNEVIYGSDFGGNPTLGAYMRLLYTHPTSTGATVRLKLTIDFHALVYQNVMIPIS